MRDKLRKKMRIGTNENGTVTVEATISLSAFMFAIVTILTIVNICIVQSKVSIAINATAKELSHYSYLYSLTGIPGSKKALNEAAEETSKDINGVLSDVNTVFTQLQNIGKESGEALEAGDITGTLDGIESDYKNIKESGGKLKTDLEELAKDPKGVAFGLVKMAAADGWDLATSRLIAGPLSKGLCKKNLVSERGGDVESYLKHLGVKPAANGSYYDGLDFSKSTIFPKGSNVIKVNVEYDVKVIALLPIDFSFHFNQTAITNGWMTGDESYRTLKEKFETEANTSLWTEADAKDRANFIRHQGIQEYSDLGYEKLKGGSYSDVHMYNDKEKEFIAFHSLNPLGSAEGERTLTLEDISEKALISQIEHYCVGINDSTKSLETVNTVDSPKEGYKCSNNKQRVIIVIPEDEGLSEYMQDVVKKCNTRGVTVDIQAGYGKGARTSEVKPQEGGTDE